MKRLLCVFLAVLLLPAAPVLAEQVPDGTEVICTYKREDGVVRPIGATPWSFACAPVNGEEYLPLSCFSNGWFREKHFNWDDGAVHSPTAMSAGENSDAVVEFTAPSDGTVLLCGVTLTKSEMGDGVRLKITRNEETVYPQNGWARLLPGQELAIPDIVLDVHAGDMIRYRLNKFSSSDADILEWPQKIVYLREKQGVRFGAGVVAPVPQGLTFETVSRSTDDFKREKSDCPWQFYTAVPETDEFYPLEYIQYGWFSGELNNWTLGAVQSAGQAHPGVGGDIVYTYTCPKDGVLAIPALQISDTGKSGDGVGIAIFKNKSPLYPDSGLVKISPTADLSLPDFLVAVSKGDKIRFRLSALANQDDDGVFLDPAVVYVNGAETLFEDVAELSDVDGHWAEDAVRSLYREGIVKGKNGGFFDPETTVTRAEFISMVTRALAIPAPAYRPVYRDVSFTAWYASAVWNAFAYDLIADELTPDNRFLPDQPITREEMTVVMTDALQNERRGVLEKSDLSTFSDADAIADWAKDKVAYAVGNGLLQGNPDGTLSPKTTATRAESAVIIKRLLEAVTAPVPEGTYNGMYDAPEYGSVDIEKIISDAYAAGEKSVTLPKGVYRLSARGKQGHIVLKDISDFTVNGYGTVLIWQDPEVPGIVLRRCENLTFNGLEADYERLSYFQGTVTEIAPDSRSYVLELDSAYPHHLLDTRLVEQGLNIRFFDESLRRIPNTGTMGDYVEKIGQYRYRVFCYDSPSNAVKRMEQVPTGALASGFCKRAYCYDVRECGSITYNDCAVYSGSGAVLEMNGTGGSVYRNFRVVPGPRPLGAKHDRCIGVGGGFFIQSTRKGALIENCEFSHTSDDTLDVLSIYGRVAGQEDDRTVVIAMPMNDEMLVSVGDKIRFSTENNVQVAEATVKEVAKTDYRPDLPLSGISVTGAEQTFPWFYRVTLDRSVKVEPRYLSVNVSLAGNGLTIRNCRYSEIHPRAVLTHANDMLVENCTFDSVSVSAIKFEPEVDWGEGGYVQNATVRNCTFINCGTEIELPGTDDVCAISLIGYEGRDHRDITIENCVFEGQYRQDIIASCVTGLTLKNNRFGPQAEDAKEYNVDDYPAIKIFNSTNVRGSGNTFTDGRGTDIAEDVTDVKGL